MEKNIHKHILISIILFFIIILVKPIFVKSVIPYGNQVTVGSLLFLIYGFYLIFVACLSFKQAVNSSKWKVEILKSYLLVLLFVLFVALLSDLDSRGLITNILRNPYDFFTDDLPFTIGLVGASIVFPISLFTGYISIKSLILSNKKRMSYSQGISLLILSLIFLALSFISFIIVLQFWLQGGIMM